MNCIENFMSSSLSIVAHVFTAPGIYLISHCLAMGVSSDFTVLSFRSHKALLFLIFFFNKEDRLLLKKGSVL
jgi:hypothetical protein